MEDSAAIRGVRKFYEQFDQHCILDRLKKKLEKEGFKANYIYNKEIMECTFKFLYKSSLFVTPALVDFDPDNKNDVNLMLISIKEVKDLIKEIEAKYIARIKLINVPESIQPS